MSAAPDETAIRRLRRCGWAGVAGLAAGLPLVYAVGRKGIFDGYAVGAALGWIVVAALTALCFRTAAARSRGERGPVTALMLLSLFALACPGVPIAALAPLALFVSGARLIQHMDPRELLYFGLGLFGVAFFVAIATILVTARRLRRLDRAK